MSLSIEPNEVGTPDQPDYTVALHAKDGRKIEVGRIFLAGAPKDRPWLWSLEFYQRKGRAAPYDGNAADFESAKAAWTRCWESASIPIDSPPASLAKTRRIMLARAINLCTLVLLVVAALQFGVDRVLDIIGTYFTNMTSWLTGARS